MKHILLILSCCIAWTLQGAEDRIWVDVTINGQPVHMAFDTGSSISALFPKTIDRLHLKLPNFKTEKDATPGMLNIPATEPCNIEYTNAGGSLTGRMQFGVVNFSSYVQTDVEGVLSWHVVRSNVFIFTNNVLNLRTNVPPQALQWQKFSMRTDTGILGFDVTGGDPQHRAIFIDTGDFTGVALNHKLWEKWEAQHTNRLATLVAFEKLTGDTFIKKTLWANEIALGSLVLTNVTVRELDIKEEPPFGTSEPLAVLGLYAMRRLDLVADDLHGVVYARPRNSPPDFFEHNRLGAIFVPPTPDSDLYIAHVASGSPAEAAGIQDNDLLLRIDDYDLKNWRTDPNRKPLRSYWIRPPGTTYRLTLARGDKQYQTTVSLKQIIGPDETAPTPSPAPPGAVDPQWLAGLQAKAQSGDPQAQYDLGVAFLAGKSGLAKDEVEAAKWFRNAADQNHAGAQSHLGTCYLQGRGVAQDAVEAVRWFRNAIEQNDASAQNNLGLCYADGVGVPQDVTEAVSWFRKAAAQDYAPAQGNLGSVYFSGEGVKKDETEALRWWRKAAEQDDVKSQFNVSACYLKGNGVAKDAVEAVKWCRKAAEANYALAQGNLALCYVEGNGVEKDEVQAYKWILLAAAQGNQDAKNFVAFLAERLTPKQILDGQKRARDFKPRLTDPAFSVGPRALVPSFAPSPAH